MTKKSRTRRSVLRGARATMKSFGYTGIDVELEAQKFYKALRDWRGKYNNGYRNTQDIDIYY